MIGLLLSVYIALNNCYPLLVSGGIIMSLKPELVPPIPEETKRVAKAA